MYVFIQFADIAYTVSFKKFDSQHMYVHRSRHL